MTRISDLLGAGRTYSFEFYPPKTDEEQRRLAQTLHDLQPLEPSFVSVTYRGGPSSNGLDILAMRGFHARFVIDVRTGRRIDLR